MPAAYQEKPLSLVISELCFSGVGCCVVVAAWLHRFPLYLWIIFSGLMLSALVAAWIAGKQQRIKMPRWWKMTHYVAITVMAVMCLVAYLLSNVGLLVITVAASTGFLVVMSFITARVRNKAAGSTGLT